MNIIDEIKAFFAIKNAVEKEIQEGKQMNGTTPGWKTSEFWLSLLGTIGTVVGALKGVISPNVAAGITATISGVYTIVRGWVKTTDSSTSVGN